MVLTRSRISLPMSLSQAYHSPAASDQQASRSEGSSIGQSAIPPGQHVQATSRQPTQRKPSTGNGDCPLCGATFKSLRGHILNVHGRFKVKEMGREPPEKAILACGYCCEAFTDKYQWASHVARKSCRVVTGVPEWHVINQVLGILRYAINHGGEQRAKEREIEVADIARGLSAGTHYLSTVLPALEQQAPMTPELFERTVGLLKANGICEHNIIDPDYIHTSTNSICRICPGTQNPSNTNMRKSTELTTQPWGAEASARGARPCNHCSGRFPNEEDCLDHTIQRHPDVAEVCSICNQLFEDLESLLEHVENQHPQAPTIICPVQGCRIRDPERKVPYLLFRHMEREHPQDPRPALYQLRYHRPSGSGYSYPAGEVSQREEGPPPARNTKAKAQAQCTKCGHVSYDKYHLTSHERVHNG